MSEQSVDATSFVAYPGGMGAGYGPLYVSTAFLERGVVRS